MKAISMPMIFAMFLLTGCSRNGVPPPGAAVDGSRPRHSVVDAILTKEEVGAVLGKPVTAVEGSGTSRSYKTGIPLLETTVEVEDKSDVHEAVQALQGARSATAMLGGKPEPVAGLGDEAFFGAMSILYVRKGDVVISVMPPNLQQVAGMAAYEKVTDAPLGSDEQLNALRNLEHVEKSDPLSVGLTGGDATQAALATVQAASRKQNTSYESDARNMVLALATKVLQKL